MIRTPTHSVLAPPLRWVSSARRIQRGSNIAGPNFSISAFTHSRFGSSRPFLLRTQQYASNPALPRYAALSTTAHASSSSSTPTSASDPKDYSTYPVADDLTVGQYHDYVEKAIDAVLDECEQLTEQYDDDGSWEVEYSQGVLNFKHPSGTWVLNRQPPTKQLWLSSPKSGPKRFDYSHAVPSSEENMGTWVCTKEGQTYSLRDILEEEFAQLVGDASFRIKGMYHDAER